MTAHYAVYYTVTASSCTDSTTTACDESYCYSVTTSATTVNFFPQTYQFYQAVEDSTIDSYVKKQQDALEKSEKLLKEMLPEGEWKQLQEVGFIEVDSCRHHGRKYRVHEEENRRIDVLENGQKVDELCIISNIPVPKWDTILAKILMARLQEDRLLAVANHIGERH